MSALLISLCLSPTHTQRVIKGAIKNKWKANKTNIRATRETTQTTTRVVARKCLWKLYNKLRRFHNSTRVESSRVDLMHCSHLLSANHGNYVISLGPKTCLDSALHTQTHWGLGTPLPHPLVACREDKQCRCFSAFAFPCDIAFHGNFLSPATTFDLSNEAAIKRDWW